MTWAELERVALALSVPLMLSVQLWPVGLVLTVIGSIGPGASPLWAVAGGLGVWRLMLDGALHRIDPMRIHPLAPPRAVLALLWVVWVVVVSLVPEALNWM